eukprot:scaffold50109_cov18-Tisochrysis_lutea.AAC.3
MAARLSECSCLPQRRYVWVSHRNLDQGLVGSALPAVEDVEYWHSPEKDGWMQCQGDYLGTWRKRWFVLKQGYLFRCVCVCVCARASVCSIGGTWPEKRVLDI